MTVTLRTACSNRRTLALLALLGLAVCAGCEDNPTDLHFLNDAGLSARKKPDAATGTPADSGSASGSDAGTDAAVSGNDAGSDDAGGDAG